MAAADLAIIDYGMSNLRSVQKAWEHLGASARVIRNPLDIGAADALIFPGQGAIADTMTLLRETGFDRMVKDWIAADKPFFGICLGLQALFEHSEEGDVAGLGIFPGQVKRFQLEAPLKIPHMGWNTVHFAALETAATPARLYVTANPAEAQTRDGEGMAAGSLPRAGDDYFYFVHSYFAVPAEEELIWGWTTYGPCTFTSAIARGRLVATQFHPEKSQSAGLGLYRSFLERL